MIPLLCAICLPAPPAPAQQSDDPALVEYEFGRLGCAISVPEGWILFRAADGVTWLGRTRDGSPVLLSAAALRLGELEAAETLRANRAAFEREEASVQEIELDAGEAFVATEPNKVEGSRIHRRTMLAACGDYVFRICIAARFSSFPELAPISDRIFASFRFAAPR